MSFRLVPYLVTLNDLEWRSTLRKHLAFDVKCRSLMLFLVLPKPEVVFNSQTMADRMIYSTEVQQEVWYCEFYVVSTIFLLPVLSQALVRHRLSPFLGDCYKQQSTLCYRTILQSGLSVTVVYCGQVVGWIRMPLGTRQATSQVTLYQLAPSPPVKGAQDPYFSGHIYCG